MGDVIQSLGDQLAEAEENLRLIRERKSEFVQETDIPLQLVRGERRLEAQIAGLRARLARLAEIPCPYRGLEPFEAEHTEFYFGRDPMVERLVAKVEEASFVAVVGSSGCGKSSLVRAGLVTALRQGALPGSRDWAIRVFRPGHDPLRALAAPLVALLEPEASEVDRLAEARKLADHLQDGTLSMDDVAACLREVHPDLPRLLLVADQFEELYTECDDEAVRRAFIDALLAAAEVEWVTVLLALRADFYGRVLEDRPLGEQVDTGLVNVLPMSEAERRAAIEGPALATGRAFEAGLVERILDDMADAPGDLPLLEFALTELWARQTAQGVLTHEAYEAIGEVQGAVARRAEAVYRELEGEGQGETVRRILLRLTHYGEGAEGTRRRATLDDLVTPRTPRAAVEPVGGALADARLLVTGRDEATGTATVEVAHEALIRGWKRLRRWLDEDRAFGLWRERLAVAWRTWEETERDEGALLRGAPLAEAEGWLAERGDDLNEAERAFIEDSLVLREREWVAREQRRRRLTLAALGTAVVFLFLAIWAWGQRNEAVQQREVAVAAEATAVAEAAARATAVAETQSLALASNAQLALGNDDTDLAIVLALEANRIDCPPDQAQRALVRAAYAPGTRRRFVGHTNWIWSVAFSPDGRTALSGSWDNTVRLWDIENGTEIHRFIGHTDWVFSVAFSPDGCTALSSSKDKGVILWDIESGAEIRRFIGHTDEVLSVAFSPDGHTALSGSADNSLILWDMESGTEIRRFIGHTDKVSNVAFSPDGHTALSGSWDSRLCLWDVESGTEIHCFIGHKDKVLSVAFSPDGRTVLSGSADNDVILWDIESGTEKRLLVGHTNWVYGVAFSPDGRTALSGSADASLRLWDVERGAEIHRFIGHTDELTSVAFSPDGRTVLSGSRDCNLRLWDLESGETTHRFSGHTGEVLSVAFSPDGRTALSGSGDNSLILWDVESGTEVRRFIGQHLGKVLCVAFNPDGRTALSGSADNSLILWDIESGMPIRYFDGHADWVWGVAFSPDGRTALSGSADKSLILWDIESGTEIHRLVGHTGWVFAVACGPDGRTALSGSADNSLILWDVESGVEIRRLSGHADWVWDVTFSPDGRTALSGSADNSLILWDIESGIEIRRFNGHTDGVTSVAFSPDGHTALSGSADTSLRLWDIESGTEIRRFVGHAHWVWSVAFSPDGRTALSGSKDYSLRLWRISCSLDELIEWTYANRYVRELTCNERELYRAEPFCDAAGNFPTRTPYPVPTPTATTELMRATVVTTTTLSLTPTVTIDADPTVYDNFGNPANDGGFNQSLWKYYQRDPSGQIAQQDGILVVTQESEEPGKGTKLAARRFFYVTLDTPILVEAELKLDPDKHSGNVQLHIDVDSPRGESWFSECGLFSYNHQAQAWARCWDTAWPRQEGHEYGTEGEPVDYGTWHTLRIEVEPALMTFTYYIDGQMVGSHIPVDAMELKKARFTFAIGVYGETLIGYIDNVRIAPIEP